MLPFFFKAPVLVIVSLSH